MKKFTPILASAALVMSMVATSMSATAAESYVPVIVKATTSEYWQTVFLGAREAAKDAGVRIEELGAAAESDIAEQIAIVENTITRQPTAIVLAPTATDPLSGVVEAATEAGIPVILIDSAVGTNAYASFLSTNNYVGGQKGAEALAQCIKDKTGKAEGKVAYLTSLAGVESLTSRDNGFLDGIKAYPGIKVVDNRIGNNDMAQGLTNTLDILSRTPDLAGLFADNAIMGVGAGAALDERGGNKPCLIAFDADEQEVSLLKDNIIDGLVVQDPYMMGYAGVWFAAAAGNGARLPKEIDTGVMVVTPSNYKESKFAGLLDPKKRELDSFVGD
ncbi:ABC transporter substrate-binding protein [Marinomonas sp. 2405UD68-3]|uniref:ABC transporter substrate-binding protein n=1 Tax=Marinomonas sp. 2405UD68-3 TaxID=3391835 RepID=UPI0039C9DBFD